MLKILIIVNQFSPFSRAIEEYLKSISPMSSVLYLSSGKDPQSGGMRWPLNVDPSNEYAIRRWIEENGWDRVVSIGFDAINFATKKISFMPILGFLEPGDVDISSRRKGRLIGFRRFSSKVRGLCFLNELEMTKAVQIGSNAPHFLIDPSTLSPMDSITSPGSGKVALVYDHRGGNRSPKELGFERLVENLGAENVESVPAQAFYWPVDGEINRKILNTTKLRFQKFENIVFVSHDPASIAGLVLLGNSQGIYAVNSIESTLLARSLPLIDVGSRLNIEKKICKETPLRGSRRRNLTIGRSIAEIMLLTETDEIPRFFEDFGDFTSYNIFLAGAAIENRSNGARPQRIRNMFLSMASDGVTIPVHFNSRALERRISLFKLWDREGIVAEVFYGENSTTPVADRDALVQVKRLIDFLAAEQGTRSMYFVRDVHWLDKNLPVGNSSKSPELVQNGIFELSQLQQSIGELVAPSFESAKMYSELAAPLFELRFGNLELPPALTEYNRVSVSPRVLGSSDGITFVYTGGLGKLYQMDCYLDALRDLFESGLENVYADFIVRESEAEDLWTELAKRELAEDDRLRILHIDFSEYVSRTKRNAGILLLDSGYGRGAFAYKSVSYLERGIPFIAYRNSPNARYFRKYHCVIDVSDEQDLLEKMKDLADGQEVDVDWGSLWANESWSARWKQVKQGASSRVREMR